MWANLLSGTIGSVIGVAASFLIAFVTLERTRRHQDDLDRERRAVEISGTLAHGLVALYDELKAVLAQSKESPSANIEPLRPLAEKLHRSIIVDAPLASVAVEERLRQTRKLMVRTITKQSRIAKTADLEALRLSLRAAGEELRELRRLKAEPARSRRSRPSSGAGESDI